MNNTEPMLVRISARPLDADMPAFLDTHDTTDAAAGVALVRKWLWAEGLNPDAYEFVVSPMEVR